MAVDKIASATRGCILQSKNAAGSINREPAYAVKKTAHVAACEQSNRQRDRVI